MLEDYCKSIQVEALTAIRMCRNDFYPSCLKYLNKMSKTSYNVRKVGINNSYIQKEVITYSYELEKLINQINLLEDKVNKAMNNETYSYETSLIWKDEVLLTLDGLRKIVDELELITPKQYWPVPTYTDLSFNN
jgi:glutamine synthetase